MAENIGNNLINGEWVKSDDYFESINPSDTSDIVGKFSAATPSDCQLAIDSARSAFSEWSKSSLEQRKAVLDFIGDELIQHSEELGYLLSREEGKPLSDGIGEFVRA